jgi:hypothetical protein
VSGTCFANTTIFKLMLLIISISISIMSVPGIGVVESCY